MSQSQGKKGGKNRVMCESGSCNESVSSQDSALQCDICKKWYHIKCVDISDTEYTFIGNHRSIHWFCDTCNSKIMNSFEEIKNLLAKQETFEKRLEVKSKELDGQIKDVTERTKSVEGTVKKLQDVDISNLVKAVASLQSEVRAIKENPPAMDKEVVKQSFADIMKSQLEAQVETQVKARVNDNMKEMSGDLVKIKVDLETTRKLTNEIRDKEARANNIIIYRVPETETKEDRKKNDQQFCLELLNQGLHIEVKEEDLKSLFRIGKAPDARASNPSDSEGDTPKPRPLMVQFKEKSLKNLVMESLTKLRFADDRFKTVSVCHDLTEGERLECKAMILEAKRKEEEDDDFLYKVRGAPGHLRIIKIKKN